MLFLEPFRCWNLENKPAFVCVCLCACVCVSPTILRPWPPLIGQGDRWARERVPASVVTKISGWCESSNGICLHGPPRWQQWHDTTPSAKATSSGYRGRLGLPRASAALNPSRCLSIRFYHVSKQSASIYIRRLNCPHDNRHYMDLCGYIAVLCHVIIYLGYTNYRPNGYIWLVNPNLISQSASNWY